jgi:hypothetical protein
MKPCSQSLSPAADFTHTVKPIHVTTNGFTKKSVASYLHLLSRNGVQRVIDVRLVNTSQLAGFSKMDDLRFFLSRFVCPPGVVRLRSVGVVEDSGLVEPACPEAIEVPARALMHAPVSSAA